MSNIDPTPFIDRFDALDDDEIRRIGGVICIAMAHQQEFRVVAVTHRQALGQLRRLERMFDDRGSWFALIVAARFLVNCFGVAEVEHSRRSAHPRLHLVEASSCD